MTVEKLSISVEQPLGTAIRAAALEAGIPVSTWLASAARVKLRDTTLAGFLEAWQAGHGAFTPEELAQARARLEGAR